MTGFIDGGVTRLIFDNTASGPVGNLIGSNNIAADDSFVYWADTSGHIMRTSRSASPRPRPQPWPPLRFH